MTRTLSSDPVVEAACHSAWGDFLTSERLEAHARGPVRLGAAVARDGVWTLHRLEALLRTIERRDGCRP